MTGTLAFGNGRRGNSLRPFVWGAAAGLLLLPAVAMQFFPASGVNWTGFDFIAMGVMLATACGLYELGAWLSGNTIYRAGFGLAALTGFLTVWVNLAVGLAAGLMVWWLGRAGTRLSAWRERDLRLSRSSG